MSRVPAVCKLALIGGLSYLSIRGLAWTSVLGTLLLVVCVLPKAMSQEGNASPAAIRSAGTSAESRAELHSVPVTDARGHVVQLRARVCRPAGDVPARLVVINHGSPPNAAARPTMQLGRCDAEAAHWFLRRGYVVVFALRRGYGETGGDWAENYGGCARGEYVRAGIETARDIDAVVSYATALPFVLHDGAVVVGQSAGGWARSLTTRCPIPGSEPL